MSSAPSAVSYARSCERFPQPASGSDLAGAVLPVTGDNSPCALLLTENRGSGVSLPRLVAPRNDFTCCKRFSQWESTNAVKQTGAARPYPAVRKQFRLSRAIARDRRLRRGRDREPVAGQPKPGKRRVDAVRRETGRESRRGPSRVVRGHGGTKTGWLTHTDTRFSSSAGSDRFAARCRGAYAISVWSVSWAAPAPPPGFS